MDEVYEEGATLYHIVYDDGDEEDLHYEECRRLRRGGHQDRKMNR